MKICNVCLKEKDEGSFPKDQIVKKGTRYLHLGKDYFTQSDKIREYKTCKECRRKKYSKQNMERKRLWRIENRDRYLETCRVRHKKNADKISVRTSELYHSENSSKKKWAKENREKIKEYHQRTYEKNKDKHSANGKLRRAVNKGILIRSPYCQICGKECKTEGHHVDYDRPLDVVWLCRNCHVKAHKIIKQKDNK